MGRLTVIALHVEGDATAVSAAMDAVRSELRQLVGPASLPVDDARAASTAPQVNGILSLDPSPAKERARGINGGAREESRNIKKKTGTLRAAATREGDTRKEPRADSLEAKALDLTRDSHQGVTSEEIYKEVGCTNIPAAYQVCAKLQKKGLVTRLDSVAWKAVNG